MKQWSFGPKLLFSLWASSLDGNGSKRLVRACHVSALEMGRSGPKIKVVQKFPKKCGVILDMYFRCFDHLKLTKPIFWASFRCSNIYIYFHIFFTFFLLKVHFLCIYIHTYIYIYICLSVIKCWSFSNLYLTMLNYQYYGWRKLLSKVEHLTYSPISLTLTHYQIV